MTEHHFPLFKNHMLCAEADPDTWFPEHGGNGKYKTPEAKMAKKICRQCPAMLECLDYALKYSGLYGIWGGTDPRERLVIQKNLNMKTISISDTVPTMWGGFTEGVTLDTGRL